MSKKTYKLHSPLIKVRSKINTEDIYYTSKDFPEKIIEGKKFMGVKRIPSDKNIRYMLKENMTFISNE
jgi:hypothetical protein